MRLSLVSMLFCLSISILSFAQDEDFVCIVVPGEGVNGVIVATDSLNQAKVKLGDTRTRTRMIYGCGYFNSEPCGKAKYLSYKKLGLQVLTLPKTKDEIVRSMVITRKKACKTKEGVGVKTLYPDVLKLLGEPESTSHSDEITTMYYPGVTIILTKDKTPEEDSKADAKIKVRQMVIGERNVKKSGK